MSRGVSVYIVAEGKTEQTFIRDVLAPELANKGIYVSPSVIGKPNHKGGCVTFERAKADLSRFLKQRQDTVISTMFDFFRIDPNWPGLAGLNQTAPSYVKAETLERAMLAEIKLEFPELRAEDRFIPYVSMYEFEALLFSSPQALAQKAGISEAKLVQVIDECGTPEEINSRPEHAPSKRIERMNPQYKKTVNGISAAKAMGLPVIREKCPHFNQWITRIEALVPIDG